mmetsp:Transcript_8695/g.12297  ORF Transcript_8695/g.12297 Transcript_8695/m.12297 type:complete len:258 (+) Transcript_8695:684-1457(+)
MVASKACCLKLFRINSSFRSEFIASKNSASCAASTISFIRSTSRSCSVNLRSVSIIEFIRSISDIFIDRSFMEFDVADITDDESVSLMRFCASACNSFISLIFSANNTSAQNEAVDSSNFFDDKSHLGTLASLNTIESFPFVSSSFVAVIISSPSIVGKLLLLSICDNDLMWIESSTSESLSYSIEKSGTSSCGNSISFFSSDCPRCCWTWSASDGIVSGSLSNFDSSDSTEKESCGGPISCNFSALPFDAALLLSS